MVEPKSSVIGDGGRAVISLMPDCDGTHVCIFESSQLEGLYGGGGTYCILLGLAAPGC